MGFNKNGFQLAPRNAHVCGHLKWGAEREEGGQREGDPQLGYSHATYRHRGGIFPFR